MRRYVQPGVPSLICPLWVIRTGSSQRQVRPCESGSKFSALAVPLWACATNSAGSERLVYRPLVDVEPALHSGSWQSRQFDRLSERHRPAHELDPARGPPIAVLLFDGRPFAVVGIVVQFVLNPVDRMLQRRTLSYIGQEAFEAGLSIGAKAPAVTVTPRAPYRSYGVASSS